MALESNKKDKTTSRYPLQFRLILLRVCLNLKSSPVAVRTQLKPQLTPSAAVSRVPGAKMTPPNSDYYLIDE